MMSRNDEATLQSNYTKLVRLLDNYPKYFKVGADRVGLKEMQQIRMSLRGNTAVFMGEDNIIRRAINNHIELYTKLLLNCNGRIVYTHKELIKVKDRLLESIVCAPAVAGKIAPLSVIIPAHNTGLGPEKISFFQALSIPIKISKGTIEIIVSYPTVASASDSIANGFKNLLIIAVVIDVEFAEAATIKEYIKDLNKFAAAATTVVASASAAGDATAVEKKEEKKEKSESEDDDMGFVLLSCT